jgi:nucleoside-diphosphate-sugar epimerase
MKPVAFLTGLTGFIGGKLAERLLAGGWTVHASLRSQSDAHGLRDEVIVHRVGGSVGELTDTLSQAAPDVVFHLASLYLADHRPEQVDELISSNLLFPCRLAEAMAGAGITRLVNTGTAWQHYGTDAYNPVNLYAATKQACVDLLRYYHDARDLSLITLKLFDTYGAGDKRRKIVQLLVDAAVSGERLGMSPGDQILDLTHVDDVVGAFENAAARLVGAERPLCEEYLISGERVSVRELVDIVSKSLGLPVHAEFGARAYREREVMVPVEGDLATSLPGWSRGRSLRSSMAELVRR